MASLICRLFGHNYGEWAYESDRSCVQTRVCKRDGHTEQRTLPHAYGAWRYIEDTRCVQVAACERCSDETTRTSHTYGAWQYVSEHSCEQRATCTCCGHEGTRQAPHQFETDEYQTYPYQQTGLVEAAICARCGAVACSVCGGELEPVEMDLDEEPPYGVLRTYRCPTCGALCYTHSRDW